MIRFNLTLMPLVLMALGTSAAAQPHEDGTMLATADAIAFVGATDADRAKAFYRDKLGLRLVSEEPSHALVFEAGHTMLRITVVRDVRPARYTVLGWKVGDIDAVIDGLVERGVIFERFPAFRQDARGIWTAPDGTRIAWFKDPDGNMLSLTQFPGKLSFINRAPYN